MAIFDTGRKQPFWCAGAAERFFDMFCQFTSVACMHKIVDHVVEAALEAFSKDAAAWSIFIRQAVVGIDPLTAEFAAALAVVLQRLQEAQEKVKDKEELAKKTRAWVEPIVALEGLDQGVKTVLEVTLQKL
jgi:U3 small nucleolar RNA-associated protein 6